MHAHESVSYLWNSPEAHLPYPTGVSLHSHTSLSRETLSFIHAMGSSMPLVDKLIRFFGKRAHARRNIILDFETANWRPPLVPRMAFDLERDQIRDLGLDPLVSITDHDCIQAPLLLRTLPDARHIPVSLEWTVPFGPAAFHLGIHNLPSLHAHSWFQRLQAFTAFPNDRDLDVLLTELHALPDVLIVFNHPAWDLHKLGHTRHTAELHRFLSLYNHLLHAFELNGLRHARENRDVHQLARRWKQILISGGDRHGLEPNANINLTEARTFTAFVHEIRYDRRSHVLFMNQYRRPWEQRILQSTIEAISDHPHFGPGWQRWDERAFHPDHNGVLRPLSELWPGGHAPLPFTVALATLRLLGNRPFAPVFSLPFRPSQRALAHRDFSREIA